VWKNNESINETITVLKGISLITKAKGTGLALAENELSEHQGKKLPIKIKRFLEGRFVQQVNN